MADQNWRNPYYKQKRRSARPKGTKRAGISLASNGGSGEMFSVFETFTNVHGQVKSISSTIRQVEEMFDSLHSIMNTFQGLGALTQAIDVSPLSKSVTTSETTNNAQSLLGNIDMQKVAQMLQSPMIQSLLSSSKEKGEG